MAQIYWISKFALTDGITQTEGIVSKEFSDLITTTHFRQAFVLGKEIHLTQNEAIERANQMKIAKIKTLQDAIDKLKAIEFVVHPPKELEFKTKIELIQAQIEDKRSECDLAINLMKSKITNIQNQCTHPTKTYHPDPSGNNDSSYACDFCGLEKRNFK